MAMTDNLQYMFQVYRGFKHILNFELAPLKYFKINIASYG